MFVARRGALRVQRGVTTFRVCHLLPVHWHIWIIGKSDKNFSAWAEDVKKMEVKKISDAPPNAKTPATRQAKIAFVECTLGERLRHPGFVSFGTDAGSLP